MYLSDVVANARLHSFDILYVFAFHGFQSREQYSNNAIIIDFKSASMCTRALSVLEHSQVPSHRISGHFKYIFNIYENEKQLCYSSLCLLWLAVNLSIVIRIVDSTNFYFLCFSYRRSSNLLALKFILFLASQIYSLYNSFCGIWVHFSSFIPRRIRLPSTKHDTVECYLEGACILLISAIDHVSLKLISVLI